MNKYFSIKRFSHLLKREFHINIKRDLLIIGAMYSLFTIIIFLIFQFGENEFREEMLEEFHFIIFSAMLFVGGAFITSFSFIELRDKLKSHFYLLTPGSILEKFLVNILISLIAYTIFMIVSYLAYSSLFNWVILKSYDIEFNGLQIFTEDFSVIINFFILFQSIFFLGATTFKKYPLILTPIVGFIVLTIFSLTIEISEKIVFANIDMSKNYSNLSLDQFVNNHESAVKLCLFYILPVIFWFVAYLKLNEKEY